MLYTVLIDTEGDHHLVEMVAVSPSETEEEDLSQLIGYRYAGYYEASSPEDALAQAFAVSDTWSGGCVA